MGYPHPHFIKTSRFWKHNFFSLKIFCTRMPRGFLVCYESHNSSSACPKTRNWPQTGPICFSSESDVSLTTHRPLKVARVHTICANAIASKWQGLLIIWRYSVQCAKWVSFSKWMQSYICTHFICSTKNPGNKVQEAYGNWTINCLREVWLSQQCWSTLSWC